MTYVPSVPSPRDGIGEPALAPGARVTFLINSMEGGGAERAMANLLPYLLPHLSAQQVELVLLDDLPLKQTLPEGLRVVTLDGRGKLLRSLGQLRRHWMTEAGRSDICVSFLARANVLNALLKRRFGHRAIISERVHTSSHIAASRIAPLLTWITRRTYPHADHVVAVGQGVAEDLVAHFGIAEDRVSVIGNPIDAAKLKRLAAETPAIDLPEDFILGVGRLVPNKNFSLLIEAHAATPGAPPLVLLGQGPEDAALKAQAARLGTSDRVFFAGFVDNPYPIMTRAHALVAASRAEGFPNTLLEAMSLGCPIISTDCPSGPADILETNCRRQPPWPETGYGLLIPMEDSAAMSAAIDTLCCDQTRAKYAARSAKRALNFRHDTVVSAYLALLAGEPSYLNGKQ